MRAISRNPEITQRELANELGISLGQVNYQLKALKDKGLVKLGNFMRSEKKSAYVYLLTPTGLREKIATTERFLERKRTEFLLLESEINELSKELTKTQPGN